MDTISPKSHEELISIVGSAFKIGDPTGSFLEFFIKEKFDVGYYLKATLNESNRGSPDFTIEIKEVNNVYDRKNDLSEIQNRTLSCAINLGSPFLTKQIAAIMKSDLCSMGSIRVKDGEIDDEGELYNFKRRAVLTTSTRLKSLKKKGYLRTRRKDGQMYWYLTSKAFEPCPVDVFGTPT